MAGWLISCKEKAPPSTIPHTDTLTGAADTIPEATAILKESTNETDTILHDDHAAALVSIREHYQRINAIQKWDKVEFKELEGVSTEGAEARFYYSNHQLQKITAWYFGETGQALVEYYVVEGKLALVNEKQANYNRPIHYDSTSMKENNDTQLLDPAKTTYNKVRSYFLLDQLLHQVYFEKDAPTVTDILLAAEQGRILPEFEQLLQLSKNQ